MSHPLPHIKVMVETGLLLHRIRPTVLGVQASLPLWQMSTTAATGARRGNEKVDGLDTRMDKGHAAHEAGLVCGEEGKVVEQILLAIGKALLFLLERFSRACLSS